MPAKGYGNVLWNRAGRATRDRLRMRESTDANNSMDTFPIPMQDAAGMESRRERGVNATRRPLGH